MAREYSDAELNEISETIIKQSSSRNTTYLGKEVRQDWDDDKFVSENLYEDFLRAVQQGKICAATRQPYNRESLFEDYLSDALATLNVRRGELSVELGDQTIDNRTYNNAKEVADMATRAITKYLEKSEKQRLIGV